MIPVIRVEKLSKIFTHKERADGFLGTISQLFWPKIREFRAIDAISFEIERGERVAFIGPNGAGKSTTIKMVTGILEPTSGNIEVLGLKPSLDRKKLGFQIGIVLGQRSQLWFHLPARDTFDLLSEIYEIDKSLYQERLKELSALFEIEELIDRPVRTLSLGQRMRCELVASLLHRPKILFLDEPTIGLDVNAKLKIRALLNRLSQDFQTTLFLTSHDTADIEQVCERVIVLDKGSILLDSSLRALKKKFVKRKLITLITDRERLSLALPGMEVIENANYHFMAEVDLEIIPIERVILEASKLAGLKDASIEDPPMEETIRNLYRGSNGKIL